MEGSKREVRPGVWRLRVYTGLRRRTTAGRDYPVLVQRTVTGNKKAADAAMRDLLAEVERGYRGRSGATVEDLMEKWLDQLEVEGRRPYTIVGYRRKVALYVLPALGPMPVANLTAEHLDDSYKRWKRKGLSAATIRQTHAIIASALSRAVDWKWIKDSPAKSARPPSVKPTPQRAIAVKALQAIYDEAQKDDDHGVLATAVALGAMTGCRRGELCALRYSDLVEDGAALNVERSLTVLNNGEWSVGPTKTHQVRRVALGVTARDALGRRHKQQEAWAAKVGVKLAADAFILSRAADGSIPCMPDGLSHGFQRVNKALGLGHHFHELRHFAATQAIAAGHDVRSVAARLGHADASTTLRIYAHALEARDQEIGDTLDKTIALPAL